MNRLTLSITALCCAASARAQPPAEENAPAEKAPRLVQAAEFPNGAGLALRYVAIRPPKDGEAVSARRELGQLEVRGLVTLAGTPVPPQRYALYLHGDDKQRWSLVAERGGAETLRWPLPMRPAPAASPRLELVLAAGDKHDEAELRIAFAGGTCQLAVAAAQGPSGDAARAEGQPKTARLELARVDAQRLHELVRLFMVHNPGTLPTWDDLITPDARGHRYLDLDAPKKDPWGNPYLITRDATNRPIVLSCGPDGQQGTPDDINPARR